MQNKDTTLPILGGLGRLLRQKNPSANPSIESKPLSSAASRPKDEAVDFPSLPDTRGIQVEEISPVEFIREWARAIARKALALTTMGQEKKLQIDRRLPNFDRRIPNLDRRVGNERRSQRHRG